jgi:Ca2+/Na+ antiporter
MDTLIAGLLFAVMAVFLYQRHLTMLIAWVILGYILAYHVGKLSHTVSVLVGLVLVYLISMVTKKTYENFDSKEEDKEEKHEKGKGESKKDDPAPAPPKTNDPHVDVGTTILHAYRNLTPEQIGGMRRDTKELMGLQKELMGSLSEMKPAIEQGAELLQTFSQFFGKNEQA